MSLIQRLLVGRLENPYITTDFAESQVEVITPAFTNIEETYNFLNALYDIVAMEIGDEYFGHNQCLLLCQRRIKFQLLNLVKGIKIKGLMSIEKYLLKKYGGKKQLISGIHFNFSFSEEFIKRLYKDR